MLTFDILPPIMYWNLLDEERLIEAFRIAHTPALMRNLMKDILTPGEKNTLTQRLKAACMLKDGATYKQVVDVTGLSSTTIARISKSLSNKKGGFYEIIKKLDPHGESYFD